MYTGDTCMARQSLVLFKSCEIEKPFHNTIKVSILHSSKKHFLNYRQTSALTPQVHSCI